MEHIRLSHPFYVLQFAIHKFKERDCMSSFPCRLARARVCLAWDEEMATSEWKCKCGIVPAGTENTCHDVPLRVRIERMSALTPHLQFLFSYIQMLLLLLLLCMLFLHLFHTSIFTYTRTHASSMIQAIILSNGIYCVCCWLLPHYFDNKHIHFSALFLFLRAFIPILITDCICTRFCSLDIARLLDMPWWCYQKEHTLYEKSNEWKIE